MKKKLVVIAVLILAAAVMGFVLLHHSFQTAPFPLPDSPVVAYRIAGEEVDGRLFANDPASVRGYAIVQERLITDAPLRQEVIDLLNSRLIYGTQGMVCFEPGIALRFGEGESRIDVLICLGCEHIYFYRGDKVEYRNLNPLGIDRIRKLYARLFPGHAADVVDDDTKAIAAARERERNRRFAALENPDSKPATAPSK